MYRIRNKAAPDANYKLTPCIRFSSDLILLRHVVMVSVEGQRVLLLAYVGQLSVQSLFLKDVFAASHAL